MVELWPVLNVKNWMELQEVTWLKPQPLAENLMKNIPLHWGVLNLRKHAINVARKGP